MYSFSGLFRRAQKKLCRSFTGAAQQQREVPLSSLGKASKWVSTHRQALVNIFGMYIVFSYSIHNYRVQLFVDEREVEYKKLNRELERVRAALGDDAWCTATEEAARKKKGALKVELDKVLHPLQQTQEEKVVAEMEKRGKADTSNAEIASVLGSIFGGGKGSTIASTTTSTSTTSSSGQQPGGTHMV